MADEFFPQSLSDSGALGGDLHHDIIQDGRPNPYQLAFAFPA